MVAGQDGVAAPRRTKTISPSYPQEALAQGVRGIVILEILIDPQGKVKSAEVIRSIPLLDEAALSAVRNWEYEVTKIDGRPVSVKLTVPITFALKVPEVTRAPGIPELRQGASVQYPPGQTSGSSVSADVTLAPDGQVAEAQVLEGSDPWTAALLSALRTWRFAAEGRQRHPELPGRRRLRGPGRQAEGGDPPLRPPAEGNRSSGGGRRGRTGSARGAQRAHDKPGGSGACTRTHCSRDPTVDTSGHAAGGDTGPCGPDLDDDAGGSRPDSRHAAIRPRSLRLRWPRPPRPSRRHHRPHP